MDRKRDRGSLCKDVFVRLTGAVERRSNESPERGASDSFMTEKRRVLILGGLPREAGGRETGGLSYSIWNNVRNLRTCSIDFLFLADNALPVGRRIGEVPEYVPRPTAVAKALLYAPRYTRQMSRFPFLRREPRIALKCAWYRVAVEQCKPHLIHAHGALRACMAGIAGLGTPILTTLHGAISNAVVEQAMPHASEVEAMALRVSDFLVTITERTFHNLAGASGYSRPRWVVNNGIDRGRMSRKAGNIASGPKIRLLTVGSLTELKNQRAVLQGIAESGCKERFVYTTIGNGPLLGLLRSEAKRLGVEFENIPFVPYEELAAHYHAAAYHILLSRSEGFGMCVAESLACGTPVILSNNMDICGEGEIITPSNSIVVDGNDPAAVSSCLSRIASGKAGVAKNDGDIDYPYDWKDIARSYERIYEELMAYRHS